MLKINHYSVPGPDWFESVVNGMRNSWESWEKGDSEVLQNGAYGNNVFKIGDNDKSLCLKLIGAGKDHGKFLRQIPILIDFTAPEYFLKEFDTYKVGTVCNRTSMMHTLGREEFKAEMFSWEDMPDWTQVKILDLLNDMRAIWIDSGKRKGPNAEMWRGMLQIVPQSWNYISTWSGNYQVLRDMYFSRRNHRLAEWRVFTDWITTLPYGELIIHE